AFTLQGLEQDFGVSRTVAREAVRVLESMRLVVSRPRTGIRVRPRQDWSVFDPQLIRWRLAGTGRMEQLRTLNELRGAVEPGTDGEAARPGGAHRPRGRPGDGPGPGRGLPPQDPGTVGQRDARGADPGHHRGPGRTYLLRPHATPSTPGGSAPAQSRGQGDP